jgi:hypothetical protein
MLRTASTPSPAVRSPRSSATLVWAGLAILAVAGVVQLLLAWHAGLSGGRDFVQDYAAVLKIGQWRDPYEPYNDVTRALFGGPEHKGPLYSFHAPSSLPLLIWMLPIVKAGGYTGTFLAWGLVSVASLWAVCWLTLTIVGVPRPTLAAALGGLALILLPAIRANFDEGQLNVAVAAGMVGCWAARRAGRSGLAGILLGAAFALKPIPGLFFVYYLWRRDWRLVGAAVLTLLVLSGLGLVLSGPGGAWIWATVNYPSHASVWPGYPDNASLRGFFTRIFGPSDWKPRPPLPLPFVSMLLWIVSGAALTLLAMLAARPPAGSTGRRSLLFMDPPAPDDPTSDVEIAVLTILSLLVTPIVWPHYYVVLVMPVTVVTVALARLIVDGGLQGVQRDPAFDRRRRLLPGLALAALGLGTTILALAHYVEPFAGNGGQQLTALLLVFGASLVALVWVGRRQGVGVSPAASR